VPKSSPAKLKYNSEYQKKHVDDRVDRNRARREAIREGRAKVGDGTEVDHVKPLAAGGSSSKSNTRVVSKSENRSWRDDHPKIYGRKKG
jgi:hypothetical protein